jgi:hypothetical protein
VSPARLVDGRRRRNASKNPGHMTRETTRRALVPAAVFLACAFLLMPHALLGQRTYAGVDLVEPKAPYRDAIGRVPHVESPVQSDQAESLAGPTAFFRALRHGVFQRWDPAVAVGQPTGTLPLGGAMSPFSVGYLFLPAWYAVGLKTFLALVFSEAFTFLLLRRLGAAAGPAILAGVAYTFSGTNLVFIHRVDVVFVVPAMFWAAHRLHARPNLRRAAVLAGLVAWGWFEGFPSGWVYAVYATAAWAAWLAVRGAPGLRAVLRRAVAPALAVAWGVALAAVTLVPFVSEVLNRGTLDVRATTVTGHIPGIQLFGLFDLSAIGPPLGGPWWSGLNPVESVSHVGMIVAVGLAIGLVAAVAGRIRLAPEGAGAWPFFCGMAAVAVVVCFLGTPLFTVMSHLPGVARNPIGRSRYLINLAGAVLGGLVLDAWWSRRGSTGFRASRAAAGALLAVLAAGVAVNLPDFARAASAANRLRYVVVHFSLGLVVAGLAVAIAAVVARRPGHRRQLGAAVLVAGLLFAELGWPLRHFTPEAPVRDFYGEQAGHRALRALLDGRYRFAGPGFSFYPNSGQVLGLPDLRGVALRSKGLRALIQAVNPGAFARDPLKIDLRREEWNLTSPLLDDLAVGYFAEGTDELPYGRVPEDADLTWDRWAPAEGMADEALAGVAPGPLNGIYLPVRVGGNCRRSSVQVSLISRGRVLAASSRAPFDTGGWTGFAILGRALAAGDPYRLAVSATRPSCHVALGMTGTRVARQLLVEDPGQAVRLASTEQSWIYQRPSAWPLVSAHRRWRAFPDQAALLAWAASRPAEDADVAAYVGPARPGGDSGQGRDPVVVSSKLADNSARAVVDGDVPSLLVVSQDLAQGWSARVDGRPAALVPVDGTLQGVFLPPGRHTVVLRYMPRSFVVGAAVSGIALLGVLVAWIGPRRRRRRA